MADADMQERKRTRTREAGSAQPPAGLARPSCHRQPSSPVQGKDKHTMAIPGSHSEPGAESPPVVPEGRDAGEYRRPAPKRGIAAQLIAPLILLTGLWVAVSPGSLPLRHAATNATTDVIIGLAVVGIGILALVSRRRSPGRQFAGLVLAVWVVLIYAFMLDARASMAAPLYC